MRFVSLFAGIGGMDLGLERAGWECVAQVENDPWCTSILEKHWPTIPKWSDIHDLDPADLPYCDAVVGGFPCQPVSLAGKRAAQDDPRWLWPEFLRVVRMVRPRIVLVENVPGLFTAGFGDVVGGLAGAGYDTEWVSVPAAAVGAPHLRWRVFIVAYPEGDLWGAPWDEGHVTFDGCGANVADTSGVRSDDTDVETLSIRCEGPSGAGGAGSGRGDGWWSVEPGMGKSVNGIPARMGGHQPGVTDANASQTRPKEDVSSLREQYDAPAFQRSSRRSVGFHQEGLLQSDLYGISLCQRHVAARFEAETDQPIPWQLLRGMWLSGESARPPHRREPGQRLTIEYPDLMRFLSRYPPPPCSACWADGSWEDGIPRVASGVPRRVDRLRGLGNAVVPQVAEWVGRRIIGGLE